MIYPEKDPTFKSLLMQGGLAALGLYKGALDNWWGDQSEEAYQAYLATQHKAHDIHSGKASSFADPKDVAAFRRCKAGGGTDLHCFSLGDNGLGAWGSDTTGPTPMCALPPEEWRNIKFPNGAKVLVTSNGHSVICELRDTMPAKANITNGAIIDLNPGAAKALGLTPPFLVDATWQWMA